MAHAERLNTTMRRAYYCLVGWAVVAMTVGIVETADWPAWPRVTLRTVGFLLVWLIFVGEVICARRERIGRTRG